jgi:hypothetical protein
MRQDGRGSQAQRPDFARRQKEKARLLRRAFPGCKSLTMSYFHTGIRTIIGAEAFHCPVRDGKEWYHLAMVIRHNLSTSRLSLDIQFIEQISFLVF